MFTDKQQTNFKCPLCGIPMISFRGNRANDIGYTIWCDNLNCPCSNENVEGHGKTIDRAYNIACAKYGSKKIDISSDTTDDNSAEYNQNVIESPKSEPDVISSPKKRGRGRPAKIKAVEPEEDLPL